MSLKPIDGEFSPTLTRTDGALSLVDLQVSGHRIAYQFEIEGQRYSGSVWYPSVDLDQLRDTVGADMCDVLALHVALFDMNKALSLKPDSVDLPPRFARLVGEDLAQLWDAVADNVWAQWRYENNLVGWRAPGLPVAANALDTSAPAEPLVVPQAEVRPPFKALVMCGGGKDSLASIRLMDEATVPFGTLGYSSSIYGTPTEQHELIEQVSRLSTGALEHHRVASYDDFLDAPVILTRGGTDITSLTAAETPFSIFMALPIMLAHGYTHLVVGHERSADDPNLLWEGVAVNHQWGKSREAELLLDAYINRLTDGRCRYFSILSPLSDPLIFQAAVEAGTDFALTHSCNVAKPWCLRCPKCAYVWLSASAYLAPATVAKTFGPKDLLEDPALRSTFRALLGLADHKPFECVGSTTEAQLALLVLSRRGGRAARALASEVRRVVDAEAAADLLSINWDRERTPADLTVAPAFERFQERARATVVPALEEAMTDTASAVVRPGEANALRKVAFVVPFDLGIRFDLSKIATLGVDRWAWDWVGGDAVEGVGPLRWTTAGRSGRRSLQFDVDDYQGDTSVPRHLAVLRLSSDTQGEHIGAERWLWDETVRGLGDNLVAEQVTVTISPFGFGSVTIVADSLPNDTFALADVRGAVETASSHIGRLFPRVAERLSADVAAHVDASWLQEHANAGQAGKVLWVHRVIHVQPLDGSDDTKWIRGLMPQASSEPLACGDGAGVAFAGIGTSVICAGDADQTFADFCTSIELGNASWAATQEQASQILDYTASVADGRRTAKLVHLKALTESVAAVQHEATFFRAVLHDQINALSPQQMDIWDALVRAWRMTAHTDELDRRRAELRAQHDETMSHLQSLHSDRLNRVMGSLTIFGGLSVLTALIDYSFGGPLSQVQLTRIWILLAAVAILGGVVRLAWFSKKGSWRKFFAGRGEMPTFSRRSRQGHETATALRPKDGPRV